MSWGSYVLCSYSQNFIRTLAIFNVVNSCSKYSLIYTASLIKEFKYFKCLSRSKAVLKNSQFIMLGCTVTIYI